MTIAHDVYVSLNLTDSLVADMIIGEDMWQRIGRVMLADPLLLLVFIGDTTKLTPSKLRKTML